MLQKTVEIISGKDQLGGILAIPEGAQGLVLFAHGSGSSRFSPRNQFVAGEMNKAGLATLLFDLLTKSEEAIDLYTREYRFNIDLLTKRLVGTTSWVLSHPETKHLNIGYFGSSTGAAGALKAAAQMKNKIGAVVSRGGRPDLAGRSLGEVRAPTLCIVGGLDYTVITLNEDAINQMTCKTELEIIPGATHLFEEPGTLEKVAKSAAHWFIQNLGSAQ